MVVKRSTDNRTKALIFDIEGTTTSISFVKETLFPYVRKNLSEFVERQWTEAEFQEVLSLLREQCTHDASSGIAGVVPIPSEGNDAELQQAVVNNILWQMDMDAKNRGLKLLQGHIMREGYKKGQLKGHVFSDVLPALKTWTQNGLKLYVYSSGSVEAQKLLFGHSEEGDMLELFSGHFDTDVGGKTEACSYTKIAKQLEFQPDEMVFFTDLPNEAAAAETAGLTAVLVVRDGNAILSDEDKASFLVIKSLSDFEWEVPAKRRKVVVEKEMPSTEDLSEEGKTPEAEDIPADVEMEPVGDSISAEKPGTQSVAEAVDEKSILSQEAVESKREILAEEPKMEDATIVEPAIVSGQIAPVVTDNVIAEETATNAVTDSSSENKSDTKQASSEKEILTENPKATEVVVEPVNKPELTNDKADTVDLLDKTKSVPEQVGSEKEILAVEPTLMEVVEPVILPGLLVPAISSNNVDDQASAVAVADTLDETKSEKEILTTEPKPKDVEPLIVAEPEETSVTDDGKAEKADINKVADLCEAKSVVNQATVGSEKENLPVEPVLNEMAVEPPELSKSEVPDIVNEKSDVAEVLDETLPILKQETVESEKKNEQVEHKLKDIAIDHADLDKIAEKIEVGQGDAIEN